MKAIRLEAKRSSEKKLIKGVEFRVALSPYFFPERVECSYNQETGCFVIDFKYLDDEVGADVQPPSDGLVNLVLGQHTGRLLSIHIHVVQHDVDGIKMLVTDEAVRALEDVKQKRPEMAPNYDLVEEALREHKDEIAAAVPA